MAQDGSILCQQGLLVRELQMYGSKKYQLVSYGTSIFIHAWIQEFLPWGWG